MARAQMLHLTRAERKSPKILTYRDEEVKRFSPTRSSLMRLQALTYHPGIKVTTVIYDDGQVSIFICRLADYISRVSNRKL